MLNLYILVLICTFLLAMLSRKHFSKYKDRGALRCLFFSMGNALYLLFERHFRVEGVRERIRSSKVLTGERLNTAVEEYFIRLFALCLGVLLVFTGASAVAYFNVGADGKTENMAVRQDYGGEDIRKSIILSKGEREISYELSILPRCLTREEFLDVTSEIFSWLRQDILGDNKDLSHIEKDLSLSYQDKDNIFEINWRSDLPECISSTGVVQRGEDPQTVHLTAEIEYMEYKAEQEFELLVMAEDSVDRDFGEAVAVLEGIEAESRYSEAVVFPDSVGDVRVDFPKEESKAHITLFLLGVFSVFLLVVKKLKDLKLENKIRDDLLIEKYSDLVNHIWLFLGTGMTIKNALSVFARNKDQNMILVKEISLSLNLIDAGANEAQAYEELGRRLGVSEYNRLFTHISQNLRMGTKDIRNIMEDEMLLAEATRREHIRKKGEEASTKLLFPMIIMLVVVMVIVMTPALVGYV